MYGQSIYSLKRRSKPVPSEKFEVCLRKNLRDSNWALRCVRIWRSFDYCIFCIFCEGAAVLLDESFAASDALSADAIVFERPRRGRQEPERLRLGRRESQQPQLGRLRESEQSGEAG